MTGPTRSSSDLDPRRRRALFRAWHRGMREMDLIMGPFAESALKELSPEELLAFERLIETPDGELYRWLVGEAPIPPDLDGPLSRRLRDFARQGSAVI